MTALMARVAGADRRAKRCSKSGSGSRLRGRGAGRAGGARGDGRDRARSWPSWRGDNLRRTGRDGNVTVVCGDGSLGYPELAPYDAISVAAGAPDDSAQRCSSSWPTPAGW